MTGFIANAGTYYVDSSATGLRNGKSWVNAWTSVNAITGLAAGDIVEISGGPSGQTRDYPMVGIWTPKGGTPEKRVTYRIGQDALHNGTANFIYAGGSSIWLGRLTNVIISGDAGDARNHFNISGYWAAAVGDHSLNARISYVTQNTGSTCMNFNPGTNLEIDHIFFYMSDHAGNGAFYLKSLGTGWDQNKIHDNTIILPRSSSGTGADCFKVSGVGYSIFNNYVASYVTNYSGSQHQDGLQDAGGSRYLRVYGNIFVNMAGYPVFLEGFFGGFQHARVDDNTLMITDRALALTAPPQGIVLTSSALGKVLIYDDVIVSNNTIIDYGVHNAITMRNVGATILATYVGCQQINNVSINSGGFGADAAVVRANNVVKTVPFPSRFANISTRLQVGTDPNALIAGFILGGDRPKRLLIRAIGPSLSHFGIANPLANPVLELRDQKGVLIARNDQWQNNAEIRQIEDTLAAPVSSSESAILATLPANNSSYTAIVRGANNGAGVGVLEVYDISSAPDSTVLNISARGFVQTGDNVMIVGFILTGNHPAKIIVRALGPSLSAAGITNRLNDPQLELRNAQGTQIAWNNDWKANANAFGVQATGVAPNEGRESAILATLPAGSYTAIVRGAGSNPTGSAVVEAYQLP